MSRQRRAVQQAATTGGGDGLGVTTPHGERGSGMAPRDGR